jgi:hypothetical protein
MKGPGLLLNIPAAEFDHISVQEAAGKGPTGPTTGGKRAEGTSSMQ